MRKIKVTLLAAVASNGVIGNGDTLIPPLEGDMAKFKERTSMENTLVVMGRTTYEGMPLIKGQVLPGRNIAVLTTSTSLRNEPRHSRHFWTAPTVEDIINGATEDAYEQIFLCGGAITYASFLDKNVVDEMILTLHDLAHEGDKIFPNFNKDLWKLDYRAPCFIGGHEAKYVFTK